MRNQIESTVKHLKNNIADIIEEAGFVPEYMAFHMELAFGKDIHSKIDGFINFANDEGLDSHDIRSTLIHDLNGALNGDVMIPRVDDYGQFSDLG